MTVLLVDNQPHSGPCQEIVVVPQSVAVCPECKGRLYLQIDCWDADTRRAHADGEGLHIECEREPEPEDDEFEDFNHQHWQSDWQPVNDRVAVWACKHVTVAEEPST